MYIELNKIYLERQNKIFIHDSMKHKKSKLLDTAYAIQLNENIKSLGFVMSVSLMNELLSLKKEDFNVLSHYIVAILKEKVGANVEYKPMYKNFPESVLVATDRQLLLDQFIGYLSDFYGYTVELLTGEEIDLREYIKFDGEPRERVKLQDNIEYKMINLGTEEEACEIFKNMMSSRIALSESERFNLRYFLENYPMAEKYIPESVPFKETFAFVLNIALEKGFSIENLPLKTATDVLRLAVSLSYGDLSLASNTLFKNFTRKEKTFLLTALNNINEYALIEDILRRKETFKRLCEKLDLFSERYSKKYTKIHEIMRGIYDRKHFKTYRNKLAYALASKNVVESVELLKKRPGEFARALDKLLRDAKGNTDFVLKEFAKIADAVPTPMLWDLYYHFEFRDETKDRIYFPKGNVSKAMLIDKELEPISNEVLTKTCQIVYDSILQQYAKREEMKYVYVNPELKRYIMPFATRSASKNSDVLTRGTRIPLKESANYVRLFLYWVGYDVDLSVTLLDEKFEFVGHVSYTNLRFGEGNKKTIVHSGDITRAPNGASEFIDIDIKQLLKETPRARYAVMSVYDFTEVGFDNIDICFAGIMEREAILSGEIYEPATVKIKADLTGATRSNLPAILDLKTKEVIWTDISTNKMIDDYYDYWDDRSPNNVENNLSSTQLACKAFVNLRKVNVFDVVFANVWARHGKLVSYSTIINENEEEVTVLVDGDGNIVKEEDVLFFDIDRGITPRMVEELTAKYL